MSFFRLIRFPNLVIVGLTQFLVYYRLVEPALRAARIRPAFDGLHLALLSLVTILITAVGYLVNDILDYDIDRINRPERMVIGRKISRRHVYRTAVFFSVSGLALAVYLALYVDNLPLVVLYPLAIAGLYLYSASWKKQPLIGNLLIAGYCAGAAGVVWLAEQPALADLQRISPEQALRSRLLFFWYMGFAFLITVFREIIKDLEDQEGDRAGGRRTVPIVWDEPRAKALAFAVGVGLLGFLIIYGLIYRQQIGPLALSYMGMAVCTPLVAALFLLGKSRTPQAFNRLSQWVKLIILTGLLLLLFV